MVDLPSVWKHKVQLRIGKGDGSSVITAGVIFDAPIALYDYDILEWILESDISTTAVMDVWVVKSPTVPIVAKSITASAKPSLTAALFNSSSTLTGWKTRILAGDRIMYNVDSNNNAKALTLSLILRRI